MNNKGRRQELTRLKQHKRIKNYQLEKFNAPAFKNKLKHTAKICSCSMCQGKEYDRAEAKRKTKHELKISEP